MAKKSKRSARGRSHSGNNSRLISTPHQKLKTTALPVVARKRGRPRKTQLVVSEKVVTAQQVEGTNRLNIASDDLQSRIRELAKLAKEQGYVTFDDLNDVLPEGLTNADDLDTILSQLRRMEIDIIEASEVDRYKEGKKESEEEEEEEKPESRFEILDDPVRMYLKQMGQVPLLTREQEVRNFQADRRGRASWCRSTSIVLVSPPGRISISPKTIGGPRALRSRYSR